MAKKRTVSRKPPNGHRRVRSELRKMRQSIFKLQSRLRERESELEQSKRSNEQARSENRAKDQFIATLSHELRTPLSSIVVWSELLTSGKLDAQTATRALQSIERNSKTQAQLVEDLLDVARIGNDKMKLNLEDVSLPHILDDALEAVLKIAEEKGVAIHTSVPTVACWMRADRVRLRQVFWNLLTNAIKFTPPGGRVDVLLENGADGAKVTVSDNGRGIAPAFLPHIFEPFKQAEDVASGPHPGLGLGLAIVRHVVELHHGTVVGASDGENKGARFAVTLPLLEQKQNAPKQPEMDETSPAPLLRGKRILIVDDEPDECAWLTATLSSADAVVVAANSVDAALDSICSCAPDLIVSDIGMPSRDGYHLLREIRNRDAHSDSHTPVVALTAYAREQDRRRALAAGFDLYIAKPVEPSVLIRLLAGVLQQQQQMKFVNS